MNDPNSKLVTGIHPRVYRRRRCAEQIPIQSRIIDLPRYRSTWRRGEIKPDSLQFDDTRHRVAISYLGRKTVACCAHIHLSIG